MTLEFLQPAFMQRALVAAVLVGLAAPAVGTYLVQRRLALLGDGIGHVALTGVAVGFLLGGGDDRWAVPGAVVVSLIGAVTIEVVRTRGRTSGDVALALLFYGGIAGGVVLIGISSGGTNANLLGYLFGSLTTVDVENLWWIAGLAALVMVLGLGLRRALFAVCHDEEFARVSGLPVPVLNVILAVTAALTVTVAMRVVGLLLVSALMVVPVATAQQVSRSFRTTMLTAMGIGVAVALGGVVVSYYADLAPGATIVLMGIGLFAVTTLARGAVRRGRVPSPFGVPAAVPAATEPAFSDEPVHVRVAHAHVHGADCGHPQVTHDDHVDYIHGGHHHVAHGDHYDEH